MLQPDTETLENVICGPFVRFKLLKSICHSIAENGREIADVHREALYNLFGERLLLKALDLVDKDAIEHVSCSERSYFVVRRPRNTYSLYTTVPYCECAQFRNKINKNQSNIMCKHIIACHVALSAGKCQMRTSTDYMSNSGIV